MSRRVAPLATLLALLSVLLAAPTAHAEAGLWDGTPGAQPRPSQPAPFAARPGQNSIKSVVGPPSQRPKGDGFIVRARPDLTSLDGPVPPVDVIHLHHGVWLNASGSSPASPIGGIQPI